MHQFEFGVADQFVVEGVRVEIVRIDGAAVTFGISRLDGEGESLEVTLPARVALAEGAALQPGSLIGWRS